MQAQAIGFSRLARQGAAASLVRRQRRLPLSRPGLRRAFVSVRRRARRRLAEDRHGRGVLRAGDQAMANIRQRRRTDAPAAHRLRRLPRLDELLVLPGAGAAAAVAGRGHRIRRHDRAGRHRPAQRPQSAGARARGRRHLLPDRRQVVERSGRARLGAAQRRDVRRLRRARPSAGRSRRCQRHRQSRRGDDVALLFVLPFGFGQAMAAFSSPLLLGAAIGVGICSSVIPYICDQLAMSRLPRASFALMLSLLPLSATLIGVDRAGANPRPHRPRRHRAGGGRRRHPQAGAAASQRSRRGRAYSLDRAPDRDHAVRLAADRIGFGQRQSRDLAGDRRVVEIARPDDVALPAPADSRRPSGNRRSRRT